MQKYSAPQFLRCNRKVLIVILLSVGIRKMGREHPRDNRILPGSEMTLGLHSCRCDPIIIHLLRRIMTEERYAPSSRLLRNFALPRSRSHQQMLLRRQRTELAADDRLIAVEGQSIFQFA